MDSLEKVAIAAILMTGVMVGVLVGLSIWTTHVERLEARQLLWVAEQLDKRVENCDD